ncbi:hypothetical protein BZA77DRAFT_362469 [Pyronema omphalodes]|nr:hypothetical protein BZA77DRAFT_362469 [Pyronema omphalodes]
MAVQNSAGTFTDWGGLVGKGKKPKCTANDSNSGEQVERLYNARSDDATRKNRDARFLKGYYITLIKQRKHTGNPDRPHNVTTALDIEHMIEEKLHMSTMRDNQTLNSGDEISEGSDKEEERDGGLSDRSDDDAVIRNSILPPAAVDRLPTPKEII